MLRMTARLVAAASARLPCVHTRARAFTHRPALALALANERCAMIVRQGLSCLQRRRPLSESIFLRRPCQQLRQRQARLLSIWLYHTPDSMLMPLL